MGMLSVYQIVLDTGRVVRVAQSNPRRTDADAPTWDDPVWLSWHPSSPVVLAS